MLCKLIIATCFCLLVVFNTITAITKTPPGNAIEIKCRASNRTREENNRIHIECCDQVVKQYYEAWSSRFYLSSFLEILQRQNCPQFEQECERRTFNFTDFTSLMYLRFCNQSQMEEQCHDDIWTIATKQNKAIQTTKRTFDELVSKLKINILSNQDLLNPCVQVAMYDTDSRNSGQYHEVINPQIPFCETVWCGFNKNIAIFKHISDWSCMPTR